MSIDAEETKLEKRIEQLEQLGFSQGVLIESLQNDLATAEARIAGIVAWQIHFPTAAMAVQEVGQVIQEIMQR